MNSQRCISLTYRFPNSRSLDLVHGSDSNRWPRSINPDHVYGPISYLKPRTPTLLALQFPTMKLNYRQDCESHLCLIRLSTHDRRLCTSQQSLRCTQTLGWDQMHAHYAKLCVLCLLPSASPGVKDCPKSVLRPILVLAFCMPLVLFRSHIDACPM